MPSLIRKRLGSRINRKGQRVETVSWQVQIPLGAGEDGRPEYLRESFKTQAEAKAFLDARREEGRAGGVIKPSDKRLSEYLPEWLDATRASIRENTADTYSRLIRLYLIPELGKRRLRDLTPLMVQNAYRRLLEKGLSARTVRFTASVLHSALDAAVRWRMLSRNAAAAAEKPKHRPTRAMRYLDQDEARRLLEACRARGEDGEPVQRLGVLFELLLVTAARPSEVLGLQWRDLDLKAGTVTIRHSLVRTGAAWRLAEPKTTKGRRTIPLPEATIDSLREWKRRQAEERMNAGKEWKGAGKPGDGFAFTTAVTGLPVEIRNLSLRDLPRLAKAAGLATEIPPTAPRRKPTYKPTFSLYTLRHTAASLMLRSGINPKIVSERLGHATASFTMDVYVHSLPGMQAEATERYGALLYGG
ncbi:MAG TPA: site-specific integrase [Thermoanaerobaculales bacterium]|nr:site-specific integrase [Thermoanaerobaculales bacterium]HQN95696.1 site-specific integrase [Thermoanaerobaculales bacterium]HQP43718.1 site-specific integrase [Thermoanaerobaculales bacterium]